MPKSLVIHVGPGKCGSSTIQDFFKKYNNSCEQNVNFIHLSVLQVEAFNKEHAEQNQSLVNFINRSFSKSETLILSNEYLFECPNAIKNICEISKNITSNISIIGYSRKQASFLVSSYGQWFFRSPERVKEVNEELIKYNINPIHFSGTEKLLIASVLNNFHSARQFSDRIMMDWYANYEEIENAISSYNAVVKCGSLPHKSSDKTLIEDFFDKANISLKEEFKTLTNLRTNAKFNPYFIEAMNAAMEFGLDIPDPHSQNQIITEISQKISESDDFKSDLLPQLMLYIDAYFRESNSKLCQKYELSENYFKNEIDNTLNKEDLLDLVKREEQLRAANNTMLKNYKKIAALMAETLIKLSKEKQTITPQKKRSKFFGWF